MLPQWRRQRDTIRLIADEEGRAFDPWRPAGAKRFVRQEEAWLGALGDGAGRAWVHVPIDWEVTSGFGFALTSGPELAAQLAALGRLTAWADGKSADPQSRKAAFDHMHRLIALDAKAQGLCQRDVAALLTDASGLAEWRETSRHRMRVAYLIARGEALRDGDYRDLIGLESQARRRRPPDAENGDPAVSA